MNLTWLDLTLSQDWIVSLVEGPLKDLIQQILNDVRMPSCGSVMQWRVIPSIITARVMPRPTA